jgi:hypothetical protein
MSAPKKKDPSITYLNALGYNVIKLPQVGIAPLSLIGKRQTTSYLGALANVWTGPEIAMPDPRPASVVNGQKSAALDLGFSLNLLASTLALFGASSPSIDLSHTSAQAMQFSYSGVTSTAVDLGILGGYLPKGKLDADNITVQQYFGKPDASAYLIYEVLRSSSITITATDSNSNAVALNVPEIQGLVGAKVSVKPSNAANTALTFASTDGTAVTFGFKAVKLLLASDLATGKLTFEDVAPSGDIAFGVPSFGAASAAAATPGVFETGPDSCLLDIGMAMED